jgi:hypothetical protein
MSYKVEAKIKKDNRAEIQKMIRGLGGAIVLKHVLGGVSALYQIYPVGPESAHLDGTPHTRDTFSVVAYEGNSPPSVEGASDVLAGNGHFSSASKKFEISKGKKLALITAGASFFLEWGTIYSPAQPLIRAAVKRIRADISKELRQLNIKVSNL